MLSVVRFEFDAYANAGRTIGYGIGDSAVIINVNYSAVVLDVEVKACCGRVATFGNLVGNDAAHVDVYARIAALFTHYHAARKGYVIESAAVKSDNACDIIGSGKLAFEGNVYVAVEGNVGNTAVIVCDKGCRIAVEGIECIILSLKKMRGISSHFLFIYR